MNWPSSSCQLNKANARSKTYEERSTIIHWYKSVEIGSGLAWNNQSLPLSLSFFSPIKVVHVWTPQKHLHNILATIPSKSTLVLCDMPRVILWTKYHSSFNSSFTVEHPRRTKFYHEKQPFWRCTSSWKKLVNFPAIATLVYRRVGYPTCFFVASDVNNNGTTWSQNLVRGCGCGCQPCGACGCGNLPMGGCNPTGCPGHGLVKIIEG